MSDMPVDARGLSVRDALEEAVKIVGSQAKLGDACGVTQTTIWRALQSGTVSAELALAIARATKGKIKKSHLRPDLWGGGKRRA